MMKVTVKEVVFVVSIVVVVVVDVTKFQKL